MGAYKRDVVVVIKMGAYIHGVLILCECLLSRFYGIIDRVFLCIYVGASHKLNYSLYCSNPPIG